MDFRVFGIRHVHVIMIFSAVTLAYTLRLNMSVAIVAMTDKSKANPYYPEFPWNEMEKSKILSAFFWGYPVLQIIAGNIAEKFGAKQLIFVAMTSTGLLTIIIPMLADWGYFTVCILRILQGVLQGLLYPSFTTLISKWMPPEERGRALGISFGGSYLGPLIGLQLSGFLASSNAGWPSIFYITGGMNCLWSFIWFWIGASSPDEHKFISTNEKNYIKEQSENSLNKDKKNVTPWRQIFKSMPFYAIIISHLGENWGFWTLATQMPNYINSVLGVNIKENGFLSSLPFLAGWGSSILFANISHRITNRNIVSKTLNKKICNSIALWGPSLFLFILGVSRSRNVLFVVITLVITIFLNSAAYSGCMVNHVDLSPNYCGTLMGITNSIATISSIIGPLSVGWLVTDTASDLQWAKVFYLSSGIMFVANLFYIIFGSADVQKWDNYYDRTAKIDAMNDWNCDE